MKTNTVKEKLARGEYAYGTMVFEFNTTGIGRIVGEAEAQARTIVRSAKYPPEGGRGAAFGVAHDNYISAPVTEVMASSNKEGFIMAQIETVSGIENCEAIAAVEGIDCLWVGHFDLSLSMGIPAQFDNP